jgi:hypothetical protein
VDIRFQSGESTTVEGTGVDQGTSEKLFARSGEIAQINCSFKALG